MIIISLYVSLSGKSGITMNPWFIINFPRLPNSNNTPSTYVQAHTWVVTLRIRWNNYQSTLHNNKLLFFIT